MGEAFFFKVYTKICARTKDTKSVILSSTLSDQTPPRSLLPDGPIYAHNCLAPELLPQPPLCLLPVSFSSRATGYLQGAFSPLHI